MKRKLRIRKTTTMIVAMLVTERWCNVVEALLVASIKAIIGTIIEMIL